MDIVPITRFDADITNLATKAARDLDLDTIRGLIDRTLAVRDSYKVLAQQSNGALRDLHELLPTLKATLAYDPSARARVQGAELDIQTHEARLRACQTESEQAEKALMILRRLSEQVQAKVLERKLSCQGVTVQEQLATGKAALTPLLDAIARAFSLVREAEVFNATSQHVKVALPSLSGDVNAVHRVGEIALTLPPEWLRLGHNERRIRFHTPFKGYAPGSVVVVSQEDADALVGRWAEPVD
jgi:ribosomal protein L22